MTKFFQAFLSGIFFTFILDFFVILGVKLNYITPHHITIYYNILFADHQNIFLFLFVSLCIGYLIIYTTRTISLVGVGLCFVFAFSTFIPFVGKRVGEYIFLQKGIHVKTKRFSYYGDIYYIGRKKVTLYDYKLKKVIILNKNKLIGALEK